MQKAELLRNIRVSYFGARVPLHMSLSGVYSQIYSNRDTSPFGFDDIVTMNELENAYRGRHYYNDVYYCRTPFFIGGSIFVFAIFFLANLKNVTGLTGWSTITAWFCWVLVLSLCWGIGSGMLELSYESRVFGAYNRKIRAAFICGFTLLLVSEIMLFGGFFWAYFDRVYNPGYVTNICMPTGMESIDFMRWPLVGTMVLVTSGYYANHTFYLQRSGEYIHFMAYACGTLALGLSFLLIQIIEYNGLTFTISDNVYGSFPFLLTGFHGFHVIVGFLFLTEEYHRLLRSTKGERSKWSWSRYNYGWPRDRALGFAFAVIYGHFVDIIWLFPFATVYVFNSGVTISEALETHLFISHSGR